MKIKLHRFAHERAFRSLSDFAQYADQQKAKFEELKESSPRDYEAWGKGIAQNWANVASAARQPEATATAVEKTLMSRPVLPIRSRLVRVLRNMIEADRRNAAHEIIPFLNGQRDSAPSSNVHVVLLDAHAEFFAALALENSSKHGQRYASIDDLVAGHEERLRAILEADLEELEQKRDRFSEMLADAESRHERLNARAKELMRLGREQWERAYADFVEQLATETAVKLWSDRASTHTDQYRSFRKWSVGFGIGGLVLTIVWIFAGFAFASAIFPQDKTAQLASYTAGSIALFTLFVWGLRVLIRSMMSENHLATDASARSALAHTYLALTKEEAATPEDRAIILSTLFAPVTDGLVKDDGMPALSPTALLAQTLTR